MRDITGRDATGRAAHQARCPSGATEASAWRLQTDTQTNPPPANPERFTPGCADCRGLGPNSRLRFLQQTFLPGQRVEHLAAMVRGDPPAGLPDGVVRLPPRFASR
jgi:hypothetical protein